MQRKACARLVACALSAWVSGPAAQDAVVVTATPIRSELFDLVSPASVLEGQELRWQRKSTIGETLDALPGVSSTYYGPAASRPVIRGLDGDRIRILQNGTGTLDASSLSFDHALPYDPLAAERVEIVRGPAAVLYGGNAVGGVVNLVDNRIPSAPIDGVTGRAEARAGGADSERSLGAVLEAGNGRIAIHADAFDRSAKDLRIPTPQGTLPNSDAKANGGAFGASATWDKGYLGLSYSGFNTNYGSVAEPEVRIDMQSQRWDIAGEHAGLKFKLGQTDYEHREIEGGAVNTTFLNKGHDGRVEYAHGKLGPFNGAVGAQFTSFDFSALGDEAFVPSTSTDAKGLFIYEELPAGDWKLSFGARGERTQVAAPTQSRDFSTASGAFGLLYSFTKDFALAANLSSTQRAPTFYELYADGPHVATGAFEVGDPNLQKEKSRSVDLGLRWRGGPHKASVSVYETRFDNYIAAFATGNLVGPDLLPEFLYQAVPARFRGFEASLLRRLTDRTGTLDLELKADAVRATDTASGTPLPRIAPARFGVGLEYALKQWIARLDVLHAAAQERVAANELPTDSYTMVNVVLNYNVQLEKAALNLFLRLSNLLDEEARNHTSFLKDIAPLGARAALLGVRGSF